MNLLEIYKKLNKEFSSRGFSLYVVGGTTRDHLLGRKVIDLDFATNATVSEMKKFLEVKSSFDNVGSLTIEYLSCKIEITTLRKESGYSDYRHPSEVEFISSCKEDSLRRDFTINALYINEEEKILDYHSGLDDLNSHIIRMIGNPEVRINEDPLRILRALRFSLILDFNIEDELKYCIKSKAYLLRNLNYTKCVNEIKKMYAFNKDKAIKILKEYGIDFVIPIDIGINEIPVIDLHCDTITRPSVSESGIFDNEDLHVDIKKLKKANYMLQCFAVFINLKYVNPFTSANKYIDLYDKQMEENKCFITKVTHYSEVMNAYSQNKIASLLTIEEGGVLEGNIKNLYHFYSRGVRMMSLTWNYKNMIGYPNVRIKENNKPDFNYIENENGLTSFGIEVVKTMNKLGMIIDVSHLGDKGVYDVLKYSTSPFVASHSNARSIRNINRNLDDNLIIELSKRHCLIGINYCPFFLGENQSDEINNIVKHIMHIRDVGGISCIVLGSDFDGIPTPNQIENASKIPLIKQALLKEGFTIEDIEKIFYKNFLRLLKRVCK